MDLSHDMGSDLALSASGDLLAASGADATRQRVLRRLLTNPGAYIWHRRYGAGLPRFVGSVANAARIQAIIKRQIQLEKGVGANPAPVALVAATVDGTVTASVAYADQDGAPQTVILT